MREISLILYLERDKGVLVSNCISDVVLTATLNFNVTIGSRTLLQLVKQSTTTSITSSVFFLFFFTINLIFDVLSETSASVTLQGEGEGLDLNIRVKPKRLKSFGFWSFINI